MKRNLDSIVLETGSHSSVDDGLCAMEAVAWLADEPHSDRPKCASMVLSAFVRTLNDSMPDDQRQKLKPYVLRLLNTADSRLELQRANIIAWASVISFATTALHAAGLVDHAETLHNLRQFDWAGAQSAAKAAAKSASRSAESTAESEARLAARLAAESVEAAARLAARLAAESVEAAARSAAWSAEAAARSAEAAARSAESTARSAESTAEKMDDSIWGLALLALDAAIEVKL